MTSDKSPIAETLNPLTLNPETPARTDSGSPRTLGYAIDAVAWYRRKWVRRGIVLAVLIGALVATAYATRDRTMPHLQQWSLLWKQRRLANTSLPPDTIVYTEETDLWSKLLARQDYARQEYGFSYRQPSEVPQDWPRGVALQRAESLPAKGGGQQLSTHFLGLLSTPSGRDWIVGIGTSLFAISTENRVVLLTQAAVSTVDSTPGTVGNSASFNGAAILLAPTDCLTLFAGQRDPQDRTHFTIAYRLNGSPGTVDAWLQDNGHVSMAVRSGPAQFAPARW